MATAYQRLQAAAKKYCSGGGTKSDVTKAAKTFVRTSPNPIAAAEKAKKAIASPCSIAGVGATKKRKSATTKKRKTTAKRKTAKR